MDSDLQRELQKAFEHFIRDNQRADVGDIYGDKDAPAVQAVETNSPGAPSTMMVETGSDSTPSPPSSANYMSALAATVTEAEHLSTSTSILDPSPFVVPGYFSLNKDLINRRAPGTTTLPPPRPGASVDETLDWLRGAVMKLMSIIAPKEAPLSIFPTYYFPKMSMSEAVDELFDIAYDSIQVPQQQKHRFTPAPPPAAPSAPSTSDVPEPPKRTFVEVFLAKLAPIIQSQISSSEKKVPIRMYQTDELFLHCSISQAAEYLQRMPEDSGSYVYTLSYLGVLSLHLYEVTWESEDLEFGVAATLLAYSKVENPVEAWRMLPNLTRNLAYGQRLLAQVTGDTDQLASATGLLEYIYNIVVDMESSPEHAMRLLRMELACCQFEHYLLLENLAKLDSSVAHFTVLCEGYDASDHARMNLGHAHLQRYLAMGTLDDLDKAIYHATIAGAVAGAANVLPTCKGDADSIAGLHLFALCLEQKFRLQLDVLYLDKAIEKLYNVIEQLKEENPLYTRAKADLATLLVLRFDSTGDKVDLENAKDVCLAAISVGGHQRNTCIPLKAIWGLVLVLLDEDVEEGVKLIARARKEFSGPKDVESRIEQVLSRALLYKYRGSKAKEDLDDAIEHARMANSKARRTSQRRAELEVDLGRLLVLSYDDFGEPALEEAMNHFICAAKVSSALTAVQLKASIEWANAAKKCGSITYVEALECGLDLLPAVAWAGNQMPVQYRLLSAQSSALASCAAAYAFGQGYPEKAVKYLERGRNVIWTQALQFRGGSLMSATSEKQYLKGYLSRLLHDDGLMLTLEDLTECVERLPPEALDILRAIMEVYEETMQNLVRLNGVEKVKNDNAVKAMISKDIGEVLLEAFLHNVATRWEELKTDLEKIRKSGELDWLSDEKFVKILEEGPVVLINAYGVQCDAVVVSCSSGGKAATLRHVRLPHMSGDLAQDWAKKLREGVYYFGIGQMKRKEFEANVLVPVLQDLWCKMVRPIVENMKEHGEVKERVWWCPTGALAFLPIHAAGPYEGDEPGLVEMLASSYIPTINSLVRACNAADESLKFLAVGMPETAGMGSLPNVIEEISAIQKHFNDHPEKILVLNNEDATIYKVSKAIREHTWLHFGCHADQDDEYPFHSAFFMHDGPLKLSKVMQLDLSRVQFAYLSACFTAAGDAALPDECIHLAAGMQFSGVRSVIAIMWSVMDEVAVRASRRVYHHLLKDGLDREVDSRGSAKALRLALLDMKKNKVPLAYRVAFIHIGI